MNSLALQLSPAEYKKAMVKLGAELGATTRPHLNGRPFAVVTTPEDADFLTRGLLESLPKDGAHLVCYWTTRLGDSATVRKEYVDPSMPRTIDTVVIAKSIIASGCIVRTNLEEFLGARKPKQILIVAPVMLKGADEHLRAAFPAAISRKFKFVTFATDTRREGEIVRPGVGGMVEKRLGLSGKIAPALVSEWRAQVSAAT